MLKESFPQELVLGAFPQELAQDAPKAGVPGGEGRLVGVGESGWSGTELKGVL